AGIRDQGDFGFWGRCSISVAAFIKKVWHRVPIAVGNRCRIPACFDHHLLRKSRTRPGQSASHTRDRNKLSQPSAKSAHYGAGHEWICGGEHHAGSGGGGLFCSAWQAESEHAVSLVSLRSGSDIADFWFGRNGGESSARPACCGGCSVRSLGFGNCAA